MRPCLCCDGVIRNWPTYACPKCGWFDRHLWTIEHVDPLRAGGLTLGDIVAEYERAGHSVPLDLAKRAARAATEGNDREPTVPYGLVLRAHRRLVRDRRAGR